MRQILLLSNSGTIALRFLCVFLAALSCHGAVAQTPTANYVKTETMLTGNGSQKQTSLQRGDDTPAATYTHNIRGWLKNLNDVGFWERILYTYNEIIDGGDSYTGNIGNLMWRNQNDTIDHNYCFYYDGEGRLDGAYYSAGEDWTEDMDRYNLKINSYDLNGNILSLKRNGRKSDGSYGLIDDLTMSYVGNRLIRVVDAADPVVTNGSMDFKDGTDTGVEYTYNASGALTSDLNKGISGIDYDINGNMSKVTFSNGNTTEYVYSQSGAKQRVIHGTVTALPFAEPGISTAEAASVSRDTTEYIGDFVFRNGVLDRLLFRGGYMDIAGGVPRYHYFATDHLGSVRTVYGEDGVAEQLLTYDLFGGIIPELSTGMGMQPYGYNGKELDHTHGLDWYDYGARHYDSPIGRWTTMDPLCEKYYNVSPYVYCHNNPVNMTDPDGKDDLFDENGNFLVRTKYGTSVMIKSGGGYTKITNVDFSNNQKVIENIGRHYLAKSDKGNFSLRVSGTDEDVPRGVAFSHTIGTDNYDLYLTDGYVNPSLGDYNDFECITYHESVHRYNPNAGYTPSGEIEAIIQTTKCEAWNNATLNYIESQAAYAKNKLNEMKVETNINNCLQRVQSAFAGYANFEYSKGIVDMSNLMEEVIIWGTKK